MEHFQYDIKTKDMNKNMVSLANKEQVFLFPFSKVTWKTQIWQKTDAPPSFSRTVYRETTESMTTLKPVQAKMSKKILLFNKFYTFLADVTYLVKKSFSLEMCIISFMVVSLLLSWTTPFSRVPSLIKTMKGILISSYLQREKLTCYCFWCMEKIR